MNAGAPRRNVTGGRFVREINRALVARGKLDAVHQALSDHWTLVLQRLFPVWCVIGPGLADPGHIEITSRTVYLASDQLLGGRDEILAGRLEPRRILATFGVGIHEVLHAKHSLSWIMDRDIALSESDDPNDRQLAVDRRLLEEPRMEATGVREFPQDTKRGRFIRAALSAAVVDVIVPRLAEAMMIEALATGGVSRDLAGRAFVYTGARCGYLLDETRLGGLPKVWTQALGADDVAMLTGLCARLLWVPDGENGELDRFAAAYRAIIGPPPPPPASGSHGLGQGQGHSQGGGDADAQRQGGGDGQGSSGDRDTGHQQGPGDSDGSAAGPGQPTPQSLSDALEQAMAGQRDGQLEQLNEDIDLQKLLKSAASADRPKGGARGTGMPTGRLPDRGVNRPPFPDEVHLARQFARRLHQARDTGQKQLGKQTPGGKFRPRGYVQAYAQRKLGVPVTARPWRITKVTRAPLLEPHVAIIVDSSGSMSVYEPALGAVVWVLSTGLRDFGGRCAIALFGNSAELLDDGSQPLRLVPGIRTGGGTAFASDAITLCAEHLEFDNPRRPRFVYVISDGGVADSETSVRKIRELRELGVPTLHLSIGAPPLAIDADRITVISDPAECMDVVGQDTVEALKARRRR